MPSFEYGDASIASNGYSDGHGGAPDSSTSSTNDSTNCLTNGHANGHTNGHANGITNGASNGINGHAYTNGTSDGVDGILDHSVEPIAIVGMAMRLPGGVHSPESFWEFLVDRRSGRCRVPKDRYNVDAFYNGTGKRGTVATEYGYFLEDLDLANMDASFWSMTKGEAEVMDPQQRLMLEVVYECLESAGEKNWRGKDVGCWVANFGEDWLDMDNKDIQNSRMYRLTGYGDYTLANRVSYEFDFNGPRYAAEWSSLG